MPIFRVNILGRNKSLLVRGETATKVKDSLVKAKALTAKELADAFGEPVWAEGDELPADEAEADPAPDGDSKPATEDK